MHAGDSSHTPDAPIISDRSRALLARLSVNQERFLLEYNVCGDKNSAYRWVYTPGEDTNVSAAVVALFRSAKINEAFESLRDDFRSRMENDLHASLAYLNRTIAYVQPTPPTRSEQLKAMELLCKVRGYFKDAASVTTVTAPPADYSKLSTDELTTLAGLLAKASGATIPSPGIDVRVVEALPVGVASDPERAV